MNWPGHVKQVHVKSRHFSPSHVKHNLWLAGIIAGAVYSLLYMRSQTLWSPILAHAVTNGMLGLWIISTNHWTYW